MNATEREIALLALQPTAERVQALKRIITPSDVQAVLRQTGQDRRHCRRLPPWFMVWFVIALGLFCCDSYRQVYRWLQCFQRRRTPGRSTLCEARQGLGVAPLRLVADRVVRLQGTSESLGVFYRGMRLMSLDSFVVDVPDSDANVRVFGRPGSSRSPAAFPQVRVLSLCETGTHVLWRSLLKPHRRSEVVMAPALLRSLQADMLLLWDRSFLSYTTVCQVLRREAQLLARIKQNLVFVPLKRLYDGSYLARFYAAQEFRRRDEGGILVRIIEYTFDDPGRPGSGQKHRLLTTLLDARQHPAKRLIVLYHERWEEELAIDELKTHQRQRPVLRSETPAGVVQEIYGLLLGHYVVRKLMVEAAQQVEVSPRQLSFVATLKILRCRLPECPKSAPGLRRWYNDLLAEISEEILEPRRDRINPRVIKRKMSNWRKKRPEHRHYPQPTKHFRRSVVIQC
jgi:Insertion element 4 transposase N-terminal/Transposase DDE domain